MSLQKAGWYFKGTGGQVSEIVSSKSSLWTKYMTKNNLIILAVVVVLILAFVFYYKYKEKFDNIELFSTTNFTNSKNDVFNSADIKVMNNTNRNNSINKTKVANFNPLGQKCATTADCQRLIGQNTICVNGICHETG